MNATTTPRPPLTRQPPERIDIHGIPETMLWTLHNRAAEALRPDAWIHDKEAIRIYQSIDYDFHRRFGMPDGSHAIRSIMFDEGVRTWLEHHPAGTVVELAAGLETQFHRIDNGRLQWVCVDLPQAISVRERFLPPSTRCRHIALSALDFAWMDAINPQQPVFVSMQGLLMYFTKSEVKQLLSTMLHRFPGATLMFDTIPRWFSRKTLTGFWKTPHYKAPPMPWGVNRDEIATQLQAWELPISSWTEEPFRKFRVFPWGFTPWISALPVLGWHLPTVVRLVGRTGSPL